MQRIKENIIVRMGVAFLLIFLILLSFAIFLVALFTVMTLLMPVNLVWIIIILAAVCALVITLLSGDLWI